MSHVRVTVKDDNRGLGAKNGFLDEDRPTTGLDGLQDLLGRLNGKDNQLLQAEHQHRVDSRTAGYAGKRWGFDNFVSAGLLIGDRLQQPEDTSADGSSLRTNVIQSRASRTQDQKSAEAGNKKRKPAHEATGSENLGLTSLEVQGTKEARPELTGDVTNAGQVERSNIMDFSTLETEERIQRSERKAQRRSRRAAKTAARELKASRRGAPQTVTSVIAQGKAGLANVAQAPQMTNGYGRHAGRQRSIRHKKMSLMDQKALNELPYDHSEETYM
ncbi:MAG: hypothetical protein Q9199_000506 [Rusavskia elegans]